MTEALGLPADVTAGLPTTFIAGEADQALARPATDFAARLGVEPHWIAGSHMTPMTRPELVVDAVLEGVPSAGR